MDASQQPAGESGGKRKPAAWLVSTLLHVAILLIMAALTATFFALVDFLIKGGLKMLLSMFG